MFIGVDLGTTYTKIHTGDIFPSGISENICLSSNVLTLNNKQYTMEQNNFRAEFDININKGLNKNTRINFLYALYKTADMYTIFDNCICGLPCSQWKNTNTVEKFKEYLTVPEPLTLSVDGLEKTIQTESLEIVPEGSTAYYAQEMDYTRFNGRKVLLLDFGGLTINTILFDQDCFVDCHTDEFGILKVYKDMAEKITTETGYDVKYTDMFDILQYGLNIDGKPIDIEPMIKSIALSHCNNIYKNLKLKWSINTIPFVQCIGAGCITMYKYLLQYVPHAELTPNPQTIAAIGMGELAGVRL
jgi:hypothetical protein